jgi:plasmid stabilization system protein ParE
MEKYEITPEAVGDLFDIWNFIAQDKPEAADHVEAAIFRSFDFLADRPVAG